MATCPLCDDTGWKPVGEGENQRVTRCDCRLRSRSSSLLEGARIPKRYERCELGNFETELPDLPDGEHDKALARAKLLAMRFVEGYPVETSGLLIIGPIGCGKTHLAVGIIRELIRTKNVPCLFYDFRELLREIRRSYDASTSTTELDVLSPIFSVEVLLLDDLGSFGTTEWERDTIGYILNKRYSDKKTTILTTYLRNLPPPFSAGQEGESTTKAGREAQVAREVMREKTLGERIGEQMRSRLMEMCKVLEINARNYRDRKPANGNGIRL